MQSTSPNLIYRKDFGKFLTDCAKEVSAFVTPNGLYQYKVMPFGMKNSATFQLLVNSIVSDLENWGIHWWHHYIQHLRTIRKFFMRQSKAKLTISLAKSEFNCATVTYLGHVKPVTEFPRPTSKKQVMRFLGMTGYYRKFCLNFSSITEPLTRLLRKNIKFDWNDPCKKAFKELKAVLV